MVYARMSTIAVSDKLEEERAITIQDPIARVFDGLGRSDDVHAVRLYARDLVTTREILRIGRAAVRRGAHSVLVVLAYEHARQVPQFGHVERLEYLALVTRAVTVERKCRRGPLEVLLRECDARADGHLCADDTVPAEETLREYVHRPALPVRHPHLTTEQLADDTGDGAATKNGEGMTAVGSDYHVVFGYGRLETDRDGFLV